MKRWLVLAGCFIGMAVSPSATFLLPLGLFVKPVTAKFGWSRTGFTAILSATALSNAVVMPLAGALVDRFGGRRVAAAGFVASVVAMGAAGSVCGRLFTGFMLDRFPVLRVAGLVLAAQAAGFLLLVDGLRGALPAGFLLGVAQGAEIDMLGYVVARRFGRAAYARIFGTCFAITLLGATAGPVAMATVFDRTGSYSQGLMLLPVFPILAFLVLSQAGYARPGPAAPGLAGVP